MRRWQSITLLGVALILLSAAFVQSGELSTSAQSLSAASNPVIGFETPAVVDPIHTNGEPDIGIDVQGRVFVSGPTGTGTQRSVWVGSVDGGHTFRLVTPCPVVPTVPPPGCPLPNPTLGTIPPPGGGDTDIAFDRSGKQYFTDLAALICLRTATTTDGGANVSQSVSPAGCAGVPGADRQWLSVYDPAPGTPNGPQLPAAFQVPVPETKL